MKILITGVAGFIGSTLATRLLKDSHQVLGIDSLTDYYDVRIKQSNISGLSKLSGQFEFVRGDLNELDLSALLADGFDCIFHLAGQPGVRKSWGTSFDEYVVNNVLATQRLLEALKRSEKPRTRVVYASSSSVYGQAESFPTSERSVPKPYSPYGVTKLSGEHLVTLYGENFGMDTVSFRFFTVYGPRQRPDMGFSKFIHSALRRERVRVFGDGEQIRDFTYVEDIVDALVAAMCHEGPLPRVMNLSGGSSVSVNEVLSILSAELGIELGVEYSDSAIGDVRRTGGANELARSALGWTPKHSVEKGLSAQLQWVRKLTGL